MPSKETIITGAMIILIIYTLSLSLVSQVFPATQTTQTLSNSGSIQIQTTADIGIYSDSACNMPKTSLTWGTLQPGENKTQECYIKNEGTVAVILSMYANNWEPDNADDYIDLGWDYSGTPIAAEATVHVTFTLSVDSSITGITSFNFDITIVGTE